MFGGGIHQPGRPSETPRPRLASLRGTDPIKKRYTDIGRPAEAGLPPLRTCPETVVNSPLPSEDKSRRRSNVGCCDVHVVAVGSVFFWHGAGRDKIESSDFIGHEKRSMLRCLRQIGGPRTMGRKVLRSQ